MRKRLHTMIRQHVDSIDYESPTAHSVPASAPVCLFATRMFQCVCGALSLDTVSTPAIMCVCVSLHCSLRRQTLYTLVLWSTTDYDTKGEVKVEKYILFYFLKLWFWYWAVETVTVCKSSLSSASLFSLVMFIRRRGRQNNTNSVQVYGRERHNNIN